MLKNFKEMAELVKANPVKKRIVLCCAHDEHSLDAVYEAFKEGNHEIISANAKLSAERFPLGDNRPKFIFINGSSSTKIRI